MTYLGPTRDSQGQTWDSQGLTGGNQRKVAYLVKKKNFLKGMIHGTYQTSPD